MEENESIEIIVQPEVAEYRRILNELAHQKIRNLRLGLGILLVAEIIWLFNTFVIPDLGGPIHRIIFGVLSIFLALYFLVYWAFMHSIRSQAKKSASTGETITYTLGPKGFKSSTRLVTWESPWSRFSKILETNSDLLFILTGDDFVAIPKRYFRAKRVGPSASRNLIERDWRV